MSDVPARHNEPGEPDGTELLGRFASWAVVNAALPPLWLYSDPNYVDRYKRAWWLYATFLPLTLLVFWPKISAGVYWPIALTPVIHLVLLAALIGALGPTTFTWWPETLVVPGWLPGGQLSLLLLAVPVIVGFGHWLTETLDIDSDEIGIPMTEIREKSTDTGNLPKLKRDVCTLVIGETGAGKSKALELLAYQFDYDQNVATIAHDLKRDFWDFYTENTDMQVERLSIEDSTVVWNLFLDVENERQFNEIAKGIMGEADGNDPFHKPATQVLADCMIYLYRKGQDSDELPDHADLLTFLKQDYETLYEVLSTEGFAAASSINPDTGGAQETDSTMMENVRDVFVGDFAESGSFSLREYIENPNGRAVMIDTKIDEIETTGPMFRLILDLSIQFGMVADNDVNYMLDEVDQLPEMTRLSSLASAGRGVGVRGIIGIQTIGQLKHVYGTAVSGIIGNCPQGLYFSPGESSTTSYILSELGEYRETVTSKTESERSSSRTQREEERSPITSGELNKFRAGDCVVVNRTDWWIGRVELLEAVRDDLDRAGVGIDSDNESDELMTQNEHERKPNRDESTASAPETEEKQ